MGEYREDIYRKCEPFCNYELSEPSMDLKSSRRHVFSWGGLIIFIFFGGITIESFNGGFITATIQHPQIVTVIVCLYFLYNFFKYFLLLDKEKHLMKQKLYTIDVFGQSLSKINMQVRMNELNKEKYELMDHDLKNRFASGSYKDENNIRIFRAVWQRPPKNIIDAFLINENKLDDFYVQDGDIYCTYNLTPEDIEYYKLNINKHKYSNILEKLEYLIPIWLGSFILFLIAYSLIGNYTNSPEIHLISRYIF